MPQGLPAELAAEDHLPEEGESNGVPHSSTIIPAPAVSVRGAQGVMN